VSEALERARKWDAAVGVDEAVARAVAQERAAMVAWLRENGSDPSLGVHGWAMRSLADEIEHGEHRRKEET